MMNFNEYIIFRGKIVDKIPECDEENFIYLKSFNQIYKKIFKNTNDDGIKICWKLFSIKEPFIFIDRQRGTLIIADRKIKQSLNIIKTVNSNTVFVNQPLTYTITVSNPGPETATDIILIDRLSDDFKLISAPGTIFNTHQNKIIYLIPKLKTNEVKTININGSFNIPGKFKNGSKIIYMIDGIKQKNKSLTSVNVLSTQTLTITKTAIPNPVIVNSLITFAISITNPGPLTVTNINVFDFLPKTFILHTASNECTLDSLTNTVTCNINRLDAEETVIIDIVGTFSDIGSFGNAIKTYYLIEGINQNATNYITVVVDPFNKSKSSLALELTSIPPPPIVEPNHQTFIAIIKNDIPLIASDIILEIELPNDFNVIKVKSIYDSTINNNILIFNIGTLDIDSSTFIEFNITGYYPNILKQFPGEALFVTAILDYRINGKQKSTSSSITLICC